jgi:hypothetical protein
MSNDSRLFLCPSRDDHVSGSILTDTSRMLPTLILVAQDKRRFPPPPGTAEITVFHSPHGDLEIVTTMALYQPHRGGFCGIGIPYQASKQTRRDTHIPTTDQNNASLRQTTPFLLPRF